MPSATRLTSTGLALNAILTLQIHLLQLLNHMYQFSHQLHHSSVFPLLCQLLLHLLLQHQNSLLLHLSAWYHASTTLHQILRQYLHQYLHQHQLHQYQLHHRHYPHLHMSAFYQTDPECHLWNQLSRMNQIWKSLYQHPTWIL